MTRDLFPTEAYVAARPGEKRGRTFPTRWRAIAYLLHLIP
jgi:hypothetical protein